MTDVREGERPVLYRVDARVWLREESRREGRPVRLDSVSPATLDAIADLGIRWVWLGGIWRTSVQSRELHRRQARALERLGDALPDLTLEDIEASPRSVVGYRVAEDLGGDEGLESLRTDLAARELRLAVDFFPARVALDHPWVASHPEYFIRGSEESVRDGPDRFLRAASDRLLARSVEEGVPASDALALNHRHRGLRDAVMGELESVLAMADGAYLDGIGSASPARIVSAWGEASLPVDGTPPVEEEFLDQAVRRVASAAPGAVVVIDGSDAPGFGPVDAVEVLRRDPGLGALLRAGDAGAVRDHLIGREATGLPFLNSLEWDGESRSAGTLPLDRLLAAAVVAYLSPGSRLFLDGKLEGRKLPQDPLLGRRPDEKPDREIRSFYQTLLELLGRPEVSRGRVELLGVREAWEGNATWKQWLVFLHRREEGSETLLVAVNYGPARAQCYVDLEALGPAGSAWTFQDLLGLAVYTRDGDELHDRGLFLELPAWDYNVFEVRPS